MSYSLDITKLSADEFRVHELPEDGRSFKFKDYVHTKLVGKELHGDRYHLNLTPAFVKKLSAMKVGEHNRLGKGYES